MTDFEHFQMFFAKMGLQYTDEEYPDVYHNEGFEPSKVLTIGNIICFDATGKYVGSRHDSTNTWIPRKEKNALQDTTMSETAQRKTTCQRCPECEGRTHHWERDSDKREHYVYWYTCKHCGWWGMSCGACYGDNRADPDCPRCHGEGVVTEEPE